MNARPDVPSTLIRIILMCENPAVYRSLGPRLSVDRQFDVAGMFDCTLDYVGEVAATCPDVIILGISRITHFNMMVCQAIKPQCPDAAIIVLPSYIDQTDEVRAAREAGADSVMLKSIDTPALVQQIHTLVDLKS